jgi:hypothetical protein
MYALTVILFLVAAVPCVRFILRGNIQHTSAGDVLKAAPEK